MAIPEGVARFAGTGAGAKTKGKAHPEAISAGLERANKVGGGKRQAPAKAGGGKSLPKGVERRSGVEHTKSSPNTMQAGQMSIPKSGKRRQPSGVKQHSGLKAPKAVKKS